MTTPSAILKNKSVISIVQNLKLFRGVVRCLVAPKTKVLEQSAVLKLQIMCSLVFARASTLPLSARHVALRDTLMLSTSTTFAGPSQEFSALFEDAFTHTYSHKDGLC